MTFVAILMLAFALSVDAFVASFSYGMIIKKGKGISALKLAASTGLGQFLMPILGWYGAQSIYRQIEQIDHWIAFFVFLTLGIKIIHDSLQGCNCTEPKINKKLSFKELFLIGIATSIDAFVSGSMLYFMKIEIWSAAFVIGLTTFCCSVLGFNLCRILKRFSPKPLEIMSGLILILLGCKVLYDHLGA